MTSEIPRNVFAFLYLMWGGVWNKYVTFLTPKSIAKSKNNIEKLKCDCEAIIWILKNSNADFSDVVAKGYSNENILNFAMSSAVIYLHENIFELCGVKFDKRLLSKGLAKEDVLRFYVDYPPSMSIVRHLYSNWAKNPTSKFSLFQVKPHLVEIVKNKSSEILDSLESISHFEALDYAIALQDFEHPERAEAFIMALRDCLSLEVTNQPQGY